MKTGLLVGGILLILGGLYVTWVGTPSPDDPATPVNDALDWDFFCVGSGVFLLVLGALLAIYGFKTAPPPPLPAYGYPPGFPGPAGTAAPPLPWAPVPPSPPAAPSAPPQGPVPASAETKPCATCAESIDSGAKFCTNCGAPQP